jgi:hypothetical protein
MRHAVIAVTRRQEDIAMKSQAAIRGLLAGLVGVAVMTIAEKIEQAFKGPVHLSRRIRGSACSGYRISPMPSGYG